MKNVGLWITAITTCVMTIFVLSAASGGGTNPLPTQTFTVTYSATVAPAAASRPILTLTLRGLPSRCSGIQPTLLKPEIPSPAGTLRLTDPARLHSGATFTMGSANVTLYAMWTLTSSFAYTVTYNGNGNTSGSVPVDPNTYTQGATVTVLGNTGNL